MHHYAFLTQKGQAQGLPLRNATLIDADKGSMVTGHPYIANRSIRTR